MVFLFNSYEMRKTILDRAEYGDKRHYLMLIYAKYLLSLAERKFNISDLLNFSISFFNNIR